MKMRFRRKRTRVYKGLIAGSIGGLAASWVMTRFQIKLSRALATPPDSRKEHEDDATVQTANKISSEVLDHELSPEEKKVAGPLVHYAYGAGIGALYGGLVQKYQTASSGFGTAYGAAAWALGDEVAVPALGLGKKPAEVPAPQHLQALAAHLVYGVTLEGVRRLTLRVL
jgi:uncharacterized membrane protein YagU involved in acid resistance